MTPPEGLAIYFALLMGRGLTLYRCQSIRRARVARAAEGAAAVVFALLGAALCDVRYPLEERSAVILGISMLLAAEPAVIHQFLRRGCLSLPWYLAGLCALSVFGAVVTISFLVCLPAGS